MIHLFLHSSFLSSAALSTRAAAVAAFQRLAVNTLHHTEEKGRSTHPEALYIQVYLSWHSEHVPRGVLVMSRRYLSWLMIFFLSCLLFVWKATWRKPDAQPPHTHTPPTPHTHLPHTLPYAAPYGVIPVCATQLRMCNILRQMYNKLDSLKLHPLPPLHLV